MSMENTNAAEVRIRARDRALSVLNNMTAGIALASVAGVGIFGTVSAITHPGVAASSASTAGTASASSSSTTSSTSSSGLQPSSGAVSSSSGSGVAVSGGS